MPALGRLRAGERRNVTVLFADMKGFTALSSRLDPEEMESLMAQVFGSFDGIISSHGGSVEKYIGDALVAVFGVPELHEDDPERAVNSALGFLEEVQRINLGLKDRGISVEFRIGINTGLITTGRRGEHDVVTGHAMSVASRLQSAAQVNTVLVSESTHERCANAFQFSNSFPVRARPDEEAMTAYAVKGRAAGPAEEETPFVDRAEILDRMLRAFLRHDPKRVGGFLLTGEAGIGKSRTAAELVERVKQLPGFPAGVLYARAQRYRVRPFAVITDLLSSYFGIDSRMTGEAVAELVRKKLEIEQPAAEGFARLVTGGASEQDNQAFVLLYLILKSIVKRSESSAYPVVVYIDNLHFVDRSSVDFLRFFLRNADTLPFFLLTDRRPDDAARELFSGIEVVELPALDREHALTLIGSAGGAGLAPEVVRSILENARGNPLFIREYARFAGSNPDAQTLPSSIQNIFLTSVETYDPQMRDLLKKLSVFALNFTVEDARYVQEATGADPALAAPALQFFVREGILAAEGEYYQYRYDVFKKALYDSLLNYNKRILHRVVADLMVRKGNPHPMRLLHHLLRAQEYVRAADAVLELPDATSSTEVLGPIGRLMEELREDTRRYMSLAFLKSAILFNNGIGEEADTLLHGIIETAVEQRSSLYAGSAYHLLTAYNMKSYSFGKAKYCGRRALAHYGVEGRRGYSRQNVLEILATSELLRNNPDEASALLEQATRRPDNANDLFSETSLTGTRAEFGLMQGDYGESRRLLLSVIDAAGPATKAGYGVRFLLGLVHFMTCDWEELLRNDGLILDSPAATLVSGSQLNARMAVAHHMLGSGEEAQRRLQQAEFTVSRIRNDFDRVDALRTLSVALLMCGERARAAQTARTGLTFGLRHSATYPVLTLLMVLVELAMDSDDREAARFFLREADLLVSCGVLLPRRDLVLYHYYRSKLAGPDETEAEARSAAQAMSRELDAVGEHERQSALLATRSFATIRAELAAVASAPA